MFSLFGFPFIQDNHGGRNPTQNKQNEIGKVFKLQEALLHGIKMNLHTHTFHDIQQPQHQITPRPVQKRQQIVQSNEKIIKSY
jgi:hypothetical protein